MSKIEPIKNTVVNVIEELKEKKTIGTEQKLFASLKKALTKKELEHIKVNYFKQGVLFINVDSSSLLYCLSLKKEAVLLKLQEAGRKQQEIKDIYFRIGDIK